jgi:hypothetical protein
MSPVYASRRRADEFQALIEHGEVADARLGDLLVLVEGLRDLDPVVPRPEFSASLREQLMVAAQTELAPHGPATKLALPPRRSARERRIAAAVGGLALVGASAGLAAAAQSALPGDALYPLKRAIENAHTGLSMNDEAKGSSLLSSAQDRLEELTRLSARGDDDAAMSQTLTDFTDQATEASDLLLADYAESGRPSSIAELRDFTATSLASLADLAPQVDGNAHDMLIHAAAVLTQIDAAAESACPSCGGQGIDNLPAILVAGGLSTPTPSSTLTLPIGPGAGTSAEGGASGPSDKNAKKDRTGDGQKDGQLTLPGAGSDSETSTNPLEGLGDAVTGGDGSASTSNGGSGGDGLSLPGLPSSGSSTDASADDPISGLGDAVGDTLGGVGDALNP